jgi:hypothetical protein
MQVQARGQAPESWNIVEKNTNYVLASWRQIFSVVWRRDTTVDGARHLQRACRDFAKAHPRGIGLLTIVAEQAPMPSAAARQAVAEFLAHGSSYIKCSAVVMEGAGFRAAAVRSVVTGLTMLAKQAYPHRVCSVQDAVTMLSRTLTPITGRPIDFGELRTSIEELRRRAELV